MYKSNIVLMNITLAASILLLSACSTDKTSNVQKNTNEIKEIVAEVKETIGNMEETCASDQHLKVQSICNT
jgi:uncharacterized lipoprotein YajG